MKYFKRILCIAVIVSMICGNHICDAFAGEVCSDGAMEEQECYEVHPTVGNPYKHSTKTVTYWVYDENGDHHDETNKATVWDCVWFGSYWQDCEDTSGAKTPIKWRVLSVNGDEALLLADRCLDFQPYNTINTSITWEKSTLRTWLNDDFYNNAFSSQDKSAILKKTQVNADNHHYGTEGGNDTSDNVFLLSLDDCFKAEYGFDSTDYHCDWYTNSYDPSRRAKVTTFVKKRGACVSSGEYVDNGYWWLRSPGFDANYAAGVCYDGRVGEDGYIVSYITDDVVRPALYLNLSSSSWEPAGTVCSDGTEDETAQTGQEGGGNGGNEYASYQKTGEWIKEDATHIKYKRNGSFLKNGEYELAWVDDDAEKSVYVGKWYFDSNGYAISGQRDGKYYNENSSNGYPYGLRLGAENIKSVLSKKRASDTLAEYNFAASYSYDLDNTTTMENSIVNYKREAKAIFSTLWGYIKNKSVGRDTFKGFCDKVAYAYMNDEEKCKELLAEIINKKFDTKINSLNDNAVYKVTKFSAENILKWEKKGIENKLEKLGDGDDYKNLKKSYNENKNKLDYASQIVSLFDDAASLSTEVYKCFKDYSDNIEFLNGLKNTVPRNGALYNTINDLEFSYTSQAQRTIGDAIITAINQTAGWYNVFKGTDVEDSFPKITGNAGTDVTNYAFKALDLFGMSFGKADKILGFVKGLDKSIAATDIIVNSIYMRGDAISALRKAENRILNGDESYEAVSEYESAFFIAKELTSLQYENMNKYYSWKYNRSDKRNEKAAYCRSELEKLKKMSAYGYSGYIKENFSEPGYDESTGVFKGWNGEPVRDQWFTYKDEKYRTDNEGRALDGLRELDGHLYYFSKGTGATGADSDPRGVMQRSKVIVINNDEYNADDDGHLICNTWAYAGNELHYYGADHKWDETRSSTEAEKAIGDIIKRIDGTNNYRTSINCPVDVVAYDKNGKELAFVTAENNAESKSDGVVSCVDENGQKLICLPDNDVYSLKITAKSDGKMDCSVADINGKEGKLNFKTDYRNVEITKGDVFVGTISGNDFYLSKSGEDEYVTEIQHSLNMYEITACTSGEGGTAAGGGLILRGDFVKLTATPDEGYVFEGWYNSAGEKVSGDEEYRFAVLESQKYTADFKLSADTAMVNIGNTGYKVTYTSAVSYNGLKHIEKGGKPSRSKARDMMVSLYGPDGKEMSPTAYKLTFKNNTNVNGKKKPYFTVKLKGKVDKTTKKAFKKTKIYFDITPLDISTVTLIPKTKTKNGAVQIKKLWFYAPTGKKISLKKYKKNKGDYSENGVREIGGAKYITIKGYGNLTGTTEVPAKQ